MLIDAGDGISKEYARTNTIRKSPGTINTFTSLTNIGVKEKNIKNMSDSEKYFLTHAISDYFTDIFYKQFLTKKQSVEIYTALNKAFNEVVKEKPFNTMNNPNLIIKGSSALSLYTENFYRNSKNVYDDMDYKNRVACDEVMEVVKPKSADLDLSMPYPDEIDDKETIISLGILTFKKFISYGLLDKYLERFTDFHAVKNVLSATGDHSEDESAIREKIADLFNDHKPNDYELQSKLGKAHYTRMLRNNRAEVYELDYEEKLVSFRITESVMFPTTMIPSLILDLMRIHISFNIINKDTDKSKSIKLNIIDLSGYPESKIGNITSYISNIKTDYGDEIHSITMSKAIEEDINDMLYRRNYFVWEDSKYKKRVKRELFYRTLKTALVDMEEAMDDIKKLKDMQMVDNFKHIVENVRMMKFRLKNDIPEYVNKYDLLDEYKNNYKEYKQFLKDTCDWVISMFECKLFHDKGLLDLLVKV